MQELQMSAAVSGRLPNAGKPRHWMLYSGKISDAGYYRTLYSQNAAGIISL